mgnify:CR=1 FL=1
MFYLPKLLSNLIATLTSLEVDNFPHLELLQPENAMIASVIYVWECRIYIVNESFGLYCNEQKIMLQTEMRMHLERDPHLMGPIIRSIDHSIVGNLSFANLCVNNLLHSKQQLHAIVIIWGFIHFVGSYNG